MKFPSDSINNEQFDPLQVRYFHIPLAMIDELNAKHQLFLLVYFIH